jgi:cell division protein FtsB
MRWLVGSLLVLLVVLQHRLWLGEGGLLEARRLTAAVAEQQAENAALLKRNDALEAEVRDLKSGLHAVEERARSELGMIKEGETFYQIVEDY